MASLSKPPILAQHRAQEDIHAGNSSAVRRLNGVYRYGALGSQNQHSEQFAATYAVTYGLAGQQPGAEILRHQPP
jgi:hypothetical protein